MSEAGDTTSKYQPLVDRYGVMATIAFARVASMNVPTELKETAISLALSGVWFRCNTLHSREGLGEKDGPRHLATTNVPFTCRHPMPESLAEKECRRHDHS